MHSSQRRRSTLLGDGARHLLAGADRIGRECLTPSQLQTSRVLPLAFSDRCHALAQQAAAGKAISAADNAWLSTHRAARMNRADLAVLEAMARISRYIDGPFSPKADLLDQVRDYQRGGSFADLAMLQLRRALASSVHHHGEAAKVLAAGRERRDRENRHFAETLAGGYEAALHRDGLTPLHRLWKRTVAPVWQSEPDTRLFLVVLDGCSYPVFLELLYALSQDNAFPLGHRAGRETGASRACLRCRRCPPLRAMREAPSSLGSYRAIRSSPRRCSATRTRRRPTRHASTRTPRSVRERVGCS